MPKPYLTQTQASEYLAERLPYPVVPRDICQWYKDNALRGERKTGGKQVFYTKAALDDFIANDERRRETEHINRIASANAAANKRVVRNLTRDTKIPTIEDFKRLARAGG